MGKGLFADNKDIIILCGGIGSRLQKVVSDKPKPLAQIHDKPFLEILIEYIAGFGFKRFILSAGYMGEKIREYFIDYRKNELDIEVIIESEPLGTGGALKFSQQSIKSSSFIVMNGDSFCAVDLNSILKYHSNKSALCTLALSKIDNKADYGSVEINSNGKLISFKEKNINDTDPGYINAGIYIMENEIFDFMKEKKFSLENDLFPSLLDESIFGFKTDEEVLDIGTPERYKRALELLKNRGINEH